MGRSPCCSADNYCWGTDRGGIIYIKKEETKSPQRVGPNQKLSGSVLRIQPTQAFRMLTPCCGLTRLAAKHHTAVRSPSPLPLWDGGEKRESEACELR